MSEAKIKASQYINALARHIWTRNLCIPNFTPNGWWECDLAEFTPGGQFREYEVKLSVADFRADSKKSDEHSIFSDRQGPLLSKHQSLEIGHPYAPNQFWFVTPTGLLDPIVIPSWAGLIEISDNLGQREIKEAPVLHKNRKTDQQMLGYRKCFYYRYWNLRQKK